MLIHVINQGNFNIIRLSVIGNIYRPPSANINRFNELQSDQPNKLKENNLSRDHNLIGNFNVNILNYSKHNVTSNYMDLLLDNELLPLIVLPSHNTQMLNYMSKHNILYKHQYGFRKGHNTTLHILWYTFIIISMKISKKLTQNIIFHYL